MPGEGAIYTRTRDGGQTTRACAAWRTCVSEGVRAQRRDSDATPAVREAACVRAWRRGRHHARAAPHRVGKRSNGGRDRDSARLCRRECARPCLPAGIGAQPAPLARAAECLFWRVFSRCTVRMGSSILPTLLMHTRDGRAEETGAAAVVGIAPRGFVGGTRTCGPWGRESGRSVMP